MKELLVPISWEVSKETVAMVERSKVGDSICINEPIMPQIFNDENGLCLFAFLSEKEIPNEYIQEGYMVCDLQYILATITAVEKVLGEAPRLVIKPFDQDRRELVKKEIETLVRQN